MSNDFLYVGTNIYHYAQMRSITFSTDHNIFFTIDPFYVLDPAKTIKDIQYIDPQAHYIPWKDISNRSWDIVFSSSNLGIFFSCNEVAIISNRLTLLILMH